MKTRKLGRTDIDVSICCLGTMTYGEQNTEAQGFEQMDYALANGVNFFDTAELYAIPPKPETQGETERIIGNWFNARKSRDKVILATKVCGRSPANWYRKDKGPTEVSPAQIDEAIEGSLQRLKTDYIDLYQIHWPDRPVNMFGSFIYQHTETEFNAFEDILAALDRHVKKGNIRHIGVSNETPWGVMKYISESESKGLPRIVSIQNAYNLVNRQFETGLSEIAHRENVGLLAYSPLAQGALTGKYLHGARPEGARLTLFNRGQRYETPSAEIMIEKYVNLANENGILPSHLALRFAAERDFITSVIIGSTKMEQLIEDIATFEMPWSKDLESATLNLHKSCPNPCP